MRLLAAAPASAGRLTAGTSRTRTQGPRLQPSVAGGGRGSAASRGGGGGAPAPRGGQRNATTWGGRGCVEGGGIGPPPLEKVQVRAGAQAPALLFVGRSSTGPSTGWIRT